MKSTNTLLVVIALALGAATLAANRAPQPAVSVAAPCTDSSAACLTQIAGLYIDALISHDGSKIPLAENVRRTENALTNARGEHEVRESFVRTKMVEAARDRRFYVDPANGEVILFSLLDVNLKDVAGAAKPTTKAGNTEYKVAVRVPPGTYTVHEAERFKVVGGMITEIEIIAHVEPGNGKGSGWPIPRDDEKSQPADPM